MGKIIMGADRSALAVDANALATVCSVGVAYEIWDPENTGTLFIVTSMSRPSGNIVPVLWEGETFGEAMLFVAALVTRDLDREELKAENAERSRQALISACKEIVETIRAIGS